MAIYKVINAMKRKGVGKESGKPYQMYSVAFLQPVEIGSFGNTQVSGSGLAPVNADCSEDVFLEFAQFGEEEFPVLADLTLRIGMRDNKAVVNVTHANLVLGDKKPKLAAA